MDEKQQIEEIAGCVHGGSAKYRVEVAQSVYHKGYRKQNEGVWIRKYSDEWIDLYRCSVCDRQLTTLHGEGLADFPHCHCGAKMKGE